MAKHKRWHVAAVAQAAAAGASTDESMDGRRAGDKFSLFDRQNMLFLFFPFRSSSASFFRPSDLRSISNVGFPLIRFCCWHRSWVCACASTSLFGRAQKEGNVPYQIQMANNRALSLDFGDSLIKIHSSHSVCCHPVNGSHICVDHCDRMLRIKSIIELWLFWIIQNFRWLTNRWGAFQSTFW